MARQAVDPFRTASESVPNALWHLIDSGLAGVATLGPDGVVRSREGILSSWLPDVGRPCFESPILSGLDDDLEALRHGDRTSEPLLLPGVRLAMVRALPRCDIAITWNEAVGEHAVLTTVDQIDRPIDHWVVQQKREQRILEEKIVVASRELERVNENLRQFTSVAAHDLQAPLRQITAFAQMLRGTLGPSASNDAIDCIDTVEGCASRLTRMIAGLLDYARLSSSRFEFETVDLADAVADAKGNLGLDIQASMATITIGQLPSITGSPVLLTNLFQNLVGNSLRYAAPDRAPHIEIRTIEKSGLVRGISVADNGIGVAPDYADAIFDSFVRVPTRVKSDGVGLGLGIARRIAELHGWRLSLDREHRPGACFVIDFDMPLDPVQGPASS